MAMKNKITIVGCGPGGPDYLTAIARDEIGRAEVLIGAPRLLKAFAPSGARRIPVAADISRTLNRMALWRRRPACNAMRSIAGRRIVVLVTGDPGLCSLAQPIIRRFGRKACRVIPGISAPQAAFAELGLDWLDARIVSAHSRVPAIAPDELAESSKIAVLTGNKSARPWLRQLTACLGRAYSVFVCQNLTLPGQSVRRLRPGQVPKLDLSSRSVLLFIRREELR